MGTELFPTFTSGSQRHVVKVSQRAAQYFLVVLLVCAPVVRRNGHPRKDIGNRSRGKYNHAYICVDSLDKLIQEPENIAILIRLSLSRLRFNFNFKVVMWNIFLVQTN